ncbi:serine hydrolase domain-containing protein [Streptomyces sp. CA-253872]|uniref:serine hydrolase domain-containing protein n=1 Tax=Streptomyces sp. CA-253872 TaxID=3240067 RepID=UPI003D8DBDC3
MTNRRRSGRILALLSAPLLGALLVLGGGPAQAAAGHGAPTEAGARKAEAPAGAGVPAKAGAPAAGGSLAADVDTLVRGQLAAYRIPGAAVVIVQDGRQVFAKGYGYADVAARTPVDPERTGFFLASDAKLLTAIAVLQQVEKGRLDLDTDVNRYLKSFTIADTYPGRPVTLRALLTHTAGFDPDILGQAVTEPGAARPLGESLAAHQPRRVRPPGTVASYDNYGVALAGYLVETVTGTPFAQYVDRSVLRPLGMRSTSFAQPHPAALDARLAHGYRPGGDEGQTGENGQYGSWSPTGAGTVGTAADMGRLLRALLADDGRVLSPASVRALTHRQFGNDPRLPGLGYLLEERERGGQRMLVKDGDLPGFHGNLALLPERSVGVYVVYNGDGTDGSAAWAGQEVADRVADHFGTARTVRQSRSHADVGRYAGTYRSTRTSSHELTRLTALTGAVTVRAGAGATLVTSGPLTRDPDAGELRWVQLSPGLFQEEGGQDRIAFRDGRLLVATDASVAYERLSWYASPALHTWALVAALAVLVLAVLALPVGALVRGVRGRSAGRPAGARAAGALLWTTAALCTAAAACFLFLSTDSNALNRAVMVNDSPLLTAVPRLLTLALAGACATAVCAVLAWRKGWWRPVGRIGYTLAALAAPVFVGVCAVYRVLGW